MILYKHIYGFLARLLRSSCVLCIAVLYVLPAPQAYAQNIGINADGANPDPAAVLDIDASGLPANNKKGLLVPEVILPSTSWVGTALNPFNSHGLGSMIPGLWIYNTNTTAQTGTFAPGQTGWQNNVEPGHYWWGAATGGNRWMRQETHVIPTQFLQSTGSVTVGGSNWDDIPGLTTVTLTLRAGDRVQFSADGAIETTTNSYARGRVRVLRDGTGGPVELRRTMLDLNNQLNPISTQECIIFGILCAEEDVVANYNTYLGHANWRIFGQDNIPADGTYTYRVQVGRVSGSGDVIGGGTPSVNPQRLTNFKVEVITR
jgi:hypothetical protein